MLTQENVHYLPQASKKASRQQAINSNVNKALSINFSFQLQRLTHSLARSLKPQRMANKVIKLANKVHKSVDLIDCCLFSLKLHPRLDLCCPLFVIFIFENTINILHRLSVALEKTDEDEEDKIALFPIKN